MGIFLFCKPNLLVAYTSPRCDLIMFYKYNRVNHSRYFRTPSPKRQIWMPVHSSSASFFTSLSISLYISLFASLNRSCLQDINDYSHDNNDDPLRGNYYLFITYFIFLFFHCFNNRSVRCVLKFKYINFALRRFCFPHTFFHPFLFF